MSAQVEKLENSMVKLTIEVDEATFEKGMQFAYNKNKGKIALQGFRKGKAPRKMIEKIYGAEVFYEDAANHVIPDAYDQAVEEAGLEVVSRPNVDVEQMETGKPFIFTAEVAVKPEITVENYKGVTIEVAPVVVTKEDVDAEIKRVQEQNARLVDVTDRPIADGDEVTIDFEGFVNNEPFEGGKGADHQLVIGSKSFIDTFEEQLIGKAIGDHVEVAVSFPEDYHQESLKGQPALFQVDIKGIKVKEMPELDDEFAQDVSEYDTLADYEANIEKNLTERKETEAKREKQEAIMTQLIEATPIELPDPMVDLEAENMTYEFAQRLQYQGLNLEQYMQVTGQTMDALKGMMKGEAETKIKSRLILEFVAQAEGMSVSDEAYQEELEKMAGMYNMEVDQMTQNIGEDEKASIQQDMLNQQALEFLLAEAVIQ